MINEWGNNSEIFTALMAAVTVVLAALVGWKTTLIASYQSYQNDRKIGEQIYKIYEDAKKTFYSHPFYISLDAELLISQAIEKSDLYGFNDLSVHLGKIKTNILYGWELEKRNAGEPFTDEEIQIRKNLLNEVHFLFREQKQFCEILKIRKI